MHVPIIYPENKRHRTLSHHFILSSLYSPFIVLFSPVPHPRILFCANQIRSRAITKLDQVSKRGTGEGEKKRKRKEKKLKEMEFEWSWLSRKLSLSLFPRNAWKTRCESKTDDAERADKTAEWKWDWFKAFRQISMAISSKIPGYTRTVRTWSRLWSLLRTVSLVKESFSKRKNHAQGTRRMGGERR